MAALLQALSPSFTNLLALKRTGDQVKLCLGATLYRVLKF
jgi:hypothetical protein